MSRPKRSISMLVVCLLLTSEAACTAFAGSSTQPRATPVDPSESILSEYIPQVPPNPNPPRYTLLRFNEDYSYLSDPKNRTDFLDPLKYIPYLRAGIFAGLIASLIVAFPTGDQQAKMVGKHQPVTLAAMEGRFAGGSMAGVALIGQPNVAKRRLDNPIEIPGALSFLAYGHFGSYVRGLDEFPENLWPDNIELLYYSFHLMITLGTIFILLMACAAFQTLRGRLESSTWLLWALMLAFPFPYLANTLGWMTAELGRQPWLMYGLFRTADGYSKVVSSGDTVFTLIGFAGLYFVLGLLFLFLVGREINHGPVDRAPTDDDSSGNAAGIGYGEEPSL